MPLINWNDSISLNISDIDHQHYKLIEIINKLYDSLKENTNFDSLKETIKELNYYTQYHFNSEEHLMEIHNFPNLAMHKVEHEYFTNKVKQFENDYSLMNNNDLANEMLNFLTGWLVTHIKNTDKKIADYLKIKGLI